MLAAAYGALQDWDSLWMFDYATNTAEHVTGFFDHGRHPGKMTNNLIAAALFRRGDVQPAITRHTLSLPPEREIELARTRGGAWSIADGAQLDVPPALALQNQLALAIGTDASGLDEPPPAPSGDVFTSDTNQLRWDTSIADKGVVTIDTRRTKAVIGFTAGRSFDLGGVVIAPGTTRQDWCTLAVTLFAGQSFDTLGHAQGLIVATGDQENTAQVWKDATRTSVGSNWGRAPTLVEVIPATFILPVASSRVAVWALDARGARLSAVSVRDSGGRAQFDLGQSGSTLWYEVVIDAAAATAPTVSVSPLHRTAEAGAAVSFDFSVEGNPTQVQWTRNGTALVEETNPTLSISRLAPSDVGIYQALVSNASGSAASPRAILGLLSAEKVIGTGKEVGADIRHPNGNTFDQVLVTGVAEAVTADHALNQITRTSFIDSSNDIVQLEYSGPGTLSLVIEGGSGPAVPTHYNQSNVSYMKGHASIVVAGADERSHLTIFTVGRATAFDPSGRFDLLRPIGPTNDPANNGSPLFDGHGGTDYDGVADLAFIAILSTNGRFGSLRAANADFFATRGITGLFAPGVVFSGPVFLGNISAFGDATPMLHLGASGDVRITGGDLYQDNGRPVQASGLTQLKFTAGGDSHGRVRPAKSNRGVLHDNGVDITGKVVRNP